MDEMRREGRGQMEGGVEGEVKEGMSGRRGERRWWREGRMEGGGGGGGMKRQGRRFEGWTEGGLVGGRN